MSVDARPMYELSVVVPVYQGEHSLEALAGEVSLLASEQFTPAGRPFRVVEMILVHDGAVDDSAKTMRTLAARYGFVRPLWLSRNFGQHAATLAGMASSVGDWVVTIDEDGQHDPADVGRLLDCALERQVRLVYAAPTNAPPHGNVRNAASATAKWISSHLLGSPIGRFNSFRLIEGEVARGVAAYCGANVYIDIALSWVVGETGYGAVALREERGRRRSGYTVRRLLHHFWQLALTSGTVPLRLVSIVGVIAIVTAFVFSGIVIWQRVYREIPVQGWASTITVISLFAGITLLAIGIIAEYLGIAVSMAMGKPPYLIVSRPRQDIGPRH
jgi:glycosyltransferase involved in cell wall biosynthesis